MICTTASQPLSPQVSDLERRGIRAAQVELGPQTSPSTRGRNPNDLLSVHCWGPIPTCQTAPRPRTAPLQCPLSTTWLPLREPGCRFHELKTRVTDRFASAVPSEPGATTGLKTRWRAVVSSRIFGASSLH
jgi:hypothetical protein